MSMWTEALRYTVKNYSEMENYIPFTEEELDEICTKFDAEKVPTFEAGNRSAAMHSMERYLQPIFHQRAKKAAP